MAAPNPNPAPRRRARAPTHEAKAFLNVLTPYVTKPTIDTRNVRVIDTVNNRAVPIATVHRAIGQLKRKAENNIRDRYKLPQGFVFTPDLKIAHKSTVSKEVVRANGPAIRAQVEAQRERMTPEEKAAILRQALDKQAEKREGKAFNKAVADIQKQIAEAARRGPQDPNRLEFVGKSGLSYLHVPNNAGAFNPALAAHAIAAMINKSEGAKRKETIKFIVKGCYSRTVNGQILTNMNHQWLCLNNKDNALTIKAPYHESQIVSMLKELKPKFFTSKHENSDDDVTTTCHDIAIYAHYEPNEGGAANDYKIIKTNGMKCRSFASVNNNCMIACLLGATGTKVTRHDTLRKLYDIPLNTPIPAVGEAMEKLAQHFQVSLTIINERMELIEGNATLLKSIKANCKHRRRCTKLNY